jgi:hypothetical protein
VFADFWRSDRGRLRTARWWIRLYKRFSFRRASTCRAVGAVRPDLLAGVGEIEHIVQLLTLVDGRVRRIPVGISLCALPTSTWFLWPERHQPIVGATLPPHGLVRFEDRTRS